MTSITGSPSPKPRGGRNNSHRQTKSGSFLSAPNQFNAKQNTQQPNLPFHNNHQLPANSVPNNRGSSHSPAGIITPPQTPKSHQFLNADTPVSGKRKKNKKQDKARQEKPKSKEAAMTQILAIYPSLPVPVEIESPPMSSDERASGQNTPSKMSSTPPAKAYAGPTFHTSPAPSALPMPKFFSKSVPATPAGTSLQTMMENDSSDDAGSTSATQQSHLELLFGAARAEGMGLKRQSSGSTSSSETTLEQSSAAFGLDPESPIRSTRKMVRTPNETGLFFSMDELDKPMSPPYKERINQARSTTAPSRMPTQASLGDDEERRRMENALKQFLNLAPQSPAKKTQVSSPSPAPRAQNMSPRAQNRPPPPLFKAGPPLTQNAYQSHSRSSSNTGYFPLFPSPTETFPYGQQSATYGASLEYSATSPKGSPSHRSPYLSQFTPAPYMSPSQFSGVSHLYNNNRNSILASKLEAAKVTPEKSVTDLENDLRRVLMI